MLLFASALAWATAGYDWRPVTKDVEWKGWNECSGTRVGFELRMDGYEIVEGDVATVRATWTFHGKNADAEWSGSYHIRGTYRAVRRELVLDVATVDWIWSKDVGAAIGLSGTVDPTGTVISGVVWPRIPECGRFELSR